MEINTFPFSFKKMNKGKFEIKIQSINKLTN